MCKTMLVNLNWFVAMVRILSFDSGLNLIYPFDSKHILVVHSFPIENELEILVITF